MTVCDEPHLLAALVGGGMVTFACSGTIALTEPIIVAIILVANAVELVQHLWRLWRGRAAGSGSFDSAEARS